jgi:hypothetical protein
MQLSLWVVAVRTDESSAQGRRLAMGGRGIAVTEHVPKVGASCLHRPWPPQALKYGFMLLIVAYVFGYGPGRPGAVKRPWLSPMKIQFVRRFSMST